MVIVGKNAYPPSAGIDMGVIRRGDVVLSPVRSVHDKRQERLRQKPLTNIVCHASNVATLSKEGNPVLGVGSWYLTYDWHRKRLRRLKLISLYGNEPNLDSLV